MLFYRNVWLDYSRIKFRLERLIGDTVSLHLALSVDPLYKPPFRIQTSSSAKPFAHSSPELETYDVVLVIGQSVPAAYGDLYTIVSGRTEL